MEARGAMKMSTLQVCLDGSNCKADGGAKFGCFRVAKKPNVRHTRKAGPRSPRLEVIMQR